MFWALPADTILHVHSTGLGSFNKRWKNKNERKHYSLSYDTTKQSTWTQFGMRAFVAIFNHLSSHTTTKTDVILCGFTARDSEMPIHTTTGPCP